MTWFWIPDLERVEESKLILGCRYFFEQVSGPHSLRIFIACERLWDVAHYDGRWRVKLPKSERCAIIVRPVEHKRGPTHEGVLYIGGAWRFTSLVQPSAVGVNARLDRLQIAS